MSRYASALIRCSCRCVCARRYFSTTATSTTRTSTSTSTSTSPAYTSVYTATTSTPSRYVYRVPPSRRQKRRMRRAQHSQKQIATHSQTQQQSPSIQIPSPATYPPSSIEYQLHTIMISMQQQQQQQQQWQNISLQKQLTIHSFLRPLRIDAITNIIYPDALLLPFRIHTPDVRPIVPHQVAPTCYFSTNLIDERTSTSISASASASTSTSPSPSPSPSHFIPGRTHYYCHPLSPHVIKERQIIQLLTHRPTKLDVDTFTASTISQLTLVIQSLLSSLLTHPINITYNTNSSTFEQQIANAQRDDTTVVLIMARDHYNRDALTRFFRSNRFSLDDTPDAVLIAPPVLTTTELYSAIHAQSTSTSTSTISTSQPPFSVEISHVTIMYDRASRPLPINTLWMDMLMRMQQLQEWLN